MEYKYELVKTDDLLPIKVILHTSEKQLFIPRHWHENVEISYVLAGMIDQIYIDGREYKSRQGDIVLINSNSIHSFSVSMGKDRKAITIFISYEFMKTIDRNYDQIVFNCVSVDEKDPIRLAKFAELRLLLDSIVAAYLTKDNDSLAHINLTGLSYQLAYLLLKNFKVTKKHSTSIQTNKYLDRLTAITNYIKENYNQDLSIDLLSSMFNLSAEYFSRFFIKHLGMTVLNYIHTIRLEKSFPDLMNTDYPIIQIALKHGFPSEKSYTRVFKSVYQMTPNQYRKKHHSKNLVVEESSRK
jgi:AraC-like DNA-binding protein